MTSSSLSCTVTGLYNLDPDVAVPYRFGVVATTSAGSSPESALSNEVWPRLDAGPDVTRPTAAVSSLPTFTMGSSRTVSWSGSDNAGGSGIAFFQLRYRRAPWNGGFGSWTYPSSWEFWDGVTNSVSVAAPAGYTYCFSVQAVDEAGNPSGWSASKCSARVLDDRGLSASSGWSRSSSSAFYLGTVTATSSSGRVLTRSGAVASRLALVATTCPTCGSVKVSIGSQSLGTVRLYSSTRKNKQIKVLPSFSPKSGTVKVTSTTTGKPVLIDALGITK